MIEVSAISVRRDSTIRDALARLDKEGVGILLIVTADGVFERTVTDGDLRRLLLRGLGLSDTLEHLPRIESIVLSESEPIDVAMTVMSELTIHHLPVVDSQRRVVRVLDRRDLDRKILLSTPHMGEWEREYVDEAFRSNWIAPLGPNVDAFEHDVADYVGMPHAAALSSGTAAIHLALIMLGVGRGDAVFCSSLTFAASANPIAYQGAEPVFIDSEPDSWNMSPEALERAFAHAVANKRLPKAVIIVSLYGQCADMDPLVEICARYNVPIIEDAAESLGAKYKGRASGSFGVMSVYSFNGNKIITTSGGGMLVSASEEYVKEARFLATQARDPALHYEHTRIGYNYRMSNILAGVGRGQMRVIEERIASRRRVFQRYREALSGWDAIQWMPEPEWSFSTHWLTACTFDAACGISSTDFIKALASEQIEARPLWKPMHMQPVFRQCLSFDHGAESTSGDLFARGICLPSGSNMTDAQQDRIVDALKRVLQQH